MASQTDFGYGWPIHVSAHRQEMRTAAGPSMQALSPVGRCQSFEASADGYGRGEGIAVLALRRRGGGGAPGLAVLQGSAVNQDGRSSSLTAPNGPSQKVPCRHTPFLAPSGRPRAICC